MILANILDAHLLKDAQFILSHQSNALFLGENLPNYCGFDRLFT